MAPTTLSPDPDPACTTDTACSTGPSSAHDPASAPDTLDQVAQLLDLTQAAEPDARAAIDRMLESEGWLEPLRDHLDGLVQVAGTEDTSSPYRHALAAYRLAEAIVPQLEAFLTERIGQACERQGITLGQVQRCLDAQQRTAMRDALLRVRSTRATIDPANGAN